MSDRVIAGTGFDQAVVVSSNNQFSAAARFLSYSSPSISSVVGCTPDVTATSIVECNRNGGDPVVINGANFGVSG